MEQSKMQAENFCQRNQRCISIRIYWSLVVLAYCLFPVARTSGQDPDWRSRKITQCEKEIADKFAIVETSLSNHDWNKDKNDPNMANEWRYLHANRSAILLAILDCREITPRGTKKIVPSWANKFETNFIERYCTRSIALPIDDNGYQQNKFVVYERAYVLEALCALYALENDSTTLARIREIDLWLSRQLVQPTASDFVGWGYKTQVSVGPKVFRKVSHSDTTAIVARARLFAATYTAGADSKVEPKNWRERGDLKVKYKKGDTSKIIDVRTFLFLEYEELIGYSIDKEVLIKSVALCDKEKLTTNFRGELANFSLLSLLSRHGSQGELTDTVTGTILGNSDSHGDTTIFMNAWGVRSRCKMIKCLQSPFSRVEISTNPESKSAPDEAKLAHLICKDWTKNKFSGQKLNAKLTLERKRADLGVAAFVTLHNKNGTWIGTLPSIAGIEDNKIRIRFQITDSDGKPDDRYSICYASLQRSK